MKGLWAWIKWEFGRRIEVTGFIKVIIVERFVKGGALVIGGIILVFLSSDGNLVNLAHNVQEQLNFNPSNHQGLWSRSINWAILHFGSLGQTTETLIAIGGALYGALEFTEGVGLVLRRRWAEYLVLVATVAFLPLEFDELLHRVTLFKVAALTLNVAIAAYLIWRKRLFLERPGQEPVADVTSAEPVVAGATPDPTDTV